MVLSASADFPAGGFLGGGGEGGEEDRDGGTEEELGTSRIDDDGASADSPDISSLTTIMIVYTVISGLLHA